MKLIKIILNKFKKTFYSPIKYGRNLGVKIGDNCSIAIKYYGAEPYLIEIGNYVQITQDVRFFTHGGSWVFRKKYPNFDFFGKIKIKDNVYIGNCAMILPGITINNNVIIGAGAVVTKSVPENSIVVGNPAKIIGTIDDLEKKILPFNLNSKKMNPNEKKAFLLSLENNKFLEK